MPPVLCVDFGSAYTKVALRPDEDAPADVLQEPALAFDDEMFCVPSVVAGPVDVDVVAMAASWRAGRRVPPRSRLVTSRGSCPGRRSRPEHEPYRCRSA